MREGKRAREPAARPDPSAERVGRSGGGLEALVARAADGDRRALERVVGAIQDDVYGLSLRMLWHPEDAEDATQEILIRVVTRLGTFRGESAFRSWVYRVAANHLLTTRKRRMERRPMSFEEFGRDLDEGLSDRPLPGETEAERTLLVEEVKIGCSHGMLLCLDRERRLAYILGEILALPGPEAARILRITRASFRKRLERARRELHAFLRAKCGLVDPENPCRCHRRVDRAIELGRVRPGRLLFADGRLEDGEAVEARRAMLEVEELREEVAVLRTNPRYAPPRDFAAEIRELLDDRRFATLVDGGGP